MAAKKRLQELFEKYDVSGDGMLSEQEMHHVFSQLGIRRYQVESLFKLADANQDGVIQVHEFLAWVTDQQPKYSIRKNMNDDGTGTVDVVITNTSEVSGKKFTFTFQKPDNLEFPEGNPAEIVLKPGEQISKTLCKVVGSPWRYAWSLKVRSAPTDADDVLTNAFVDPDFPHEDGSIGKASCMRIDTAAKWVRARMLGDPTEAVLFDQVRPQDVQQGGLGDCWLMSALSCLGQYPQKLKSLFTANHLAEDGKYEVYLYNMETKEWETIVIDEFIPCNVRHGKPQPAFAKPLGEEIWVPLLEKAFAKFCGSYGALDGGSAAWAFQVLTGRTDPVHYERTFSGQFRRRRKSDAGFTAKCPQKSAWCWNSSTPPLSADELFTELQGHIADRHVLGCSIRQGPKTKHANQYGLRLNHVYSLLQMFSEELDDGTAVRLVKLRNPWGYREWNGDWSDYSADGNGSAKWKENPQLCARLDPKRSNDGVFYMSFEDWSSWFNSIDLCPVGDKPIPPEEGEADEHAAGELTDETEMMSLLSC